MTEKKAPPTSARKSPRKKAAVVQDPPLRRMVRFAARWALRGVAAVAGFFLLLVLIYSFINPPTGIYQMSESARLGGVKRDWVDWSEIAPVMGRSAVAAEDANFCLHLGFDMAAIRAAAAAGGNRGASTISQQVVKNVFLWHGRSYLRKAAEALLTPVVELLWSKQRILEVYLNIAEFGEGVFGVEAAAQEFFGVPAAKLSATQAARLAAVLPNPKERSAENPGPATRRRAAQIASGAETILADGRAACFE